MFGRRTYVQSLGCGCSMYYYRAWLAARVEPYTVAKEWKKSCLRKRQVHLFLLCLRYTSDYTFRGAFLAGQWCRRWSQIGGFMPTKSLLVLFGDFMRFVYVTALGNLNRESATCERQVCCILRVTKNSSSPNPFRVCLDSSFKLGRMQGSKRRCSCWNRRKLELGAPIYVPFIAK